ncbi:MAG: BolA/IbaG family iron-sulfur metabolism protein [gamma proteobacterium symbiont of Bathyaustriella thionipta]|nr:BolA/IbaG family iron-sulfur metabolism protein [gamma proteobacterium symbiont of Bathyaustriella thionipta]
MKTEKIEQLIKAGIPGCEVTVSGDGQHFEARVISAEFAGKAPLAKQRMVMAAVKEQINSGELHAISIKTEVP